MKTKINVMLLCCLCLIANLVFAQETESNFQLGIYGLQSPVGTKDFQTGKLSEIKSEVKDLSCVFNSAIAYRSWDRNKYPTWDFTGFVTNYMSDMFTMTNEDSCDGIIQVLTPPLYPIFSDPQDLSLSNNDVGNNRSLEIKLFKEFITSLLQKEFDLVKEACTNKIEIMEMITDKYKRPLGGFYLDDEPLVRNHDISVIEEMGKEIRRIEKKFMESNTVLSQMPRNKKNDYYHLRYIAFDCADLHAHVKAARKEDGKFYNRDGKSVSFSNGRIYSVFAPNTYDVLMPDFYKNDTRFWGEILSHIRYEYISNNLEIPILTPVISTEYREQDMKVFPENYYEVLTKYLKSQNIAGLWIYIWETTSPSFTDTKSLWENPRMNLKSTVKKLK